MRNFGFHLRFLCILNFGIFEKIRFFRFSYNYVIQQVLVHSSETELLSISWVKEVKLPVTGSTTSR